MPSFFFLIEKLTESLIIENLENSFMLYLEMMILFINLELI